MQLNELGEFGLIGLILFVFAELFRQATKYKEENDMTI